MMSRSSAGMRRGGKRMEMIRPHLTQQQQQQSINDEELEVETDPGPLGCRCCVWVCAVRAYMHVFMLRERQVN